MPKLSRELLIEIIRNNSIGIFELNSVSGSFQVDDTYASSLGYDKKALNSLDAWKRLIHPKHVESVYSQLQVFLEADDDSATLEEYPLRHRNGTYIWSRTILFKSNGLVIGSHSENASQRKELEKPVESLYKDTFDLLIDEVHIWKIIKDENGEIKTWELVDANQSALKTWEKTREEVVGKTTNEIFGYDATQKFMPIVEEIFTTGNPHRWESYFPPTKQHLSMDSIPAGTLFISTGRDITKIKKTEKKLLADKENAWQSEAKLSNLFNAMEELVFEMDYNGTYISVAPTKTNFMFQNTPEFTGKTIHDIFPQEEANLFLDFIRKCLDEDKSDKIIYPLEIDNEMIWFEGKATPIAKDRILYIATNITERKLAEEALIKNTKRLDESQRIAGMGDFIWQVETGKITWSEGMHKLLGYNQSEIIDYAKVNAEIHHPDDLDRITNWLNECLESGESNHGPNEYRLIRKDGEVLNAQLNISIKYRNHKPFEVIGTCFNITEQKIAEEALIIVKEKAEENEERYRGLFINVEIGIVLHSHDTSVITCNSRSAELLGLTEDQIKGKVAIDPYWKFIYDNGEAIPVEDYPVMRVIKTKAIHRNEVVGVIRPNKETIWLLVSGFPTINRKGEVTEVTISFIDITERKLAEEAVIIAKEKAEENEARLIEAQSVTKVGSWETDLSTLDVIWSEETYKIFEAGSKSFKASHPLFLSFVHHEDIKKVDNAFLDSFSTDGYNSIEHRIITAKQNLKYVEERWFIIKDSDGKAIKAVGTCQDITDRKLMEIEIKGAKEKAEESERLLKKIAENFPNSFVSVIEKDLSVSFTAGAEFEKQGLNPQDYIGLKVENLFGEHTQKATELYQKTFNGEKLQFELKLGDYYLYYKTVPLYDEKGAIPKILVVSENITEQKERELELRTAKIEAEKREFELRESQKIAKVGSWYYNASTDEAIWSQELYDMYGLNPNDPLPNYAETKHLYSAKSWDILAKAVERATDTGLPYELELELRRKDGSNAWIWAKGEPVLNNEKQIIGLRGIAQDITDRKLMELEIKKAKEKADLISKRFHTIFQQAPLGIALIDSYTGRIYEVNPKFAEILGRTTEQIKQIDWMSITHPDNLQEDLDNMQLLNEGTISGFNMQKRYIKPDGSHVWANMIITPVTVEVNESKRHLCMIEDITEEIHNKKKLIRSLKEVSEYKYALNQSAIVSTTDLKGEITYANDNFCKISKFSRQELIGQTHSIINSGHHPNEFWIDLWETITEGKVWRGEVKNKTKDGSYYWLDTYIVPFTDEQGKLKQYMAIRSEITEKKAKEDETVIQNQALKKANSELDTFVYRVSHDLRAPITSSLGITELCLMSDSQSETKDLLSKQLQSLNKLDKFIQDILSYSRNTRLEIKKKQIDFSSFIEEIISQHNTNYDSIDIRINVEGQVPLISDETRLTMIFNNLISNAFKFSAPYKENQFIDISAEIMSETVILKVSDNGIGIKQEYLNNVFDMFYRATDSNYGSGLGLYIAQEAVQKMGGKITIESKYEEGTSFTIILPNSSMI